MPFFFGENSFVQGNEFTLELEENEEIFFIGKLVIIINWDENIEYIVRYDILDSENGNSWSIHRDNVPQDCLFRFRDSEPHSLFQNHNNNLLLTIASYNETGFIVVELLNNERRIRILEEENELEDYEDISEEILCTCSSLNGLEHVVFEEVPLSSLPPSINNEDIVNLFVEG